MTVPLFRTLIPVFIVVLVILTLYSIKENDLVAKDEIDFMNGVSFVAPRGEFEENPYASIIDLNADWVALMPYAFTSESNPEVTYDNEKQWWGEKSSGIIKSIEYAKEKKIKVLLKPHVWVRGQGWTGDFNLDSNEDWEKWERSYTSYIMNHARLADSMNVEAFCVGLEFKNIVKVRPEFWFELIRNVRSIYHGQITYSANWDNYQNITFWNEVDFIGISAYFPLSQSETPSVEELKTAWKQKRLELLDLSVNYQKPIVFTEYGYRSIDMAAGNQWELENHRRQEGVPTFEVQNNAYLALFDTFWNEPWFLGGFLWKWYPDHQKKIDGENTDYTPQKKPVENIVREWYKKR